MKDCYSFDSILESEKLVGVSVHNFYHFQW